MSYAEQTSPSTTPPTDSPTRHRRGSPNGYHQHTDKEVA